MVVNSQKERTNPQMKGTTKAIMKQIRAGSAKSAKYFFIDFSIR